MVLIVWGERGLCIESFQFALIWVHNDLFVLFSLVFLKQGLSSTHASLEHTILSPQPQEPWDYSYVLLYPDRNISLDCSNSQENEGEFFGSEI